jgi:2-dehydropantoate 2-reductase
MALKWWSVGIAAACYALIILSAQYAFMKAKKAHGVTLKDVKNEVPGGFAARGALSLAYYFSIADWIGGWRLLSRAYLPFPSWVRIAGLCLLGSTTALFWWINVDLGSNYHGPMKLHEGHRLVTRGPYAFARHPSYLAFPLLHASLFLITMNPVLLAAGMAMSIYVNRKRVMVEERMLDERFGAEYRAYALRTGRYFPRLGHADRAASRRSAEAGPEDILVFGAGVIGSIYALRLAEAGHRVSLLARGERLASLRKAGLRARNVFLAAEEGADVEVIDALPSGAEFDLIIVALRSGQVETGLGAIADARISGTVFAVGNNLGDLDAQAAIVGAERFVPGFGAFGGYRDGDDIAYLDGRTASDPLRFSETTLGLLSESARRAMAGIRAILEGAGLPCAESRDIRAWLTCHAALVFPLSGAIYAADGDQELFCRSRDTILLGIRACKECFLSLRALGVEVEPPSIKRLLGMPERILAALLAKRFSGEAARVAMFGHANASGGRDEIGGQALVLDKRLKASGKPMPSWDALLPCFVAQGMPPHEFCIPRIHALHLEG